MDRRLPSREFARSRRLTIWQAGLLCCFALVGCVVGPDFRRPCPPDLNPNYSAMDERTIPVPQECSCWWEYFQDPTLSELVNQARGGNLDLRKAYQRVREARARLGVTRGDWFPQVEGVSSYSYRNISSRSSQFGNQAIASPPFNFYSMGFDSSWEIDLFGKIARTVEAADADARAEMEYLRYFHVTLLSDLATAYVQLRSAEARLNVAQENLALQQETLATVQVRKSTGLLDPLDEAQAQTHVLRTASRIPVLQQDRQLALNRLAVLSGVSPGDQFDARVGLGRLPQFSQSIMLGVPADLLRRRPDVRQAEYQVASANALVGVAIAERLPQVTIRGSIDVESRKVSDLFTTAALANQVGPSLRWNVLNFGRLRSNIEMRRAQFEQALLNYQQTVLLSVEEVEEGLVGYRQQTDRLEAAAMAAQSASTAAQLSRVRWEGGLVNFLTVVDTQRELLDAQEEVVMSQSEILLNVILIYKALGGGWECRVDRLPAVAESHEEGQVMEDANAPFNEPPPIDSKTDESGEQLPLPKPQEAIPNAPMPSSHDE